MQELIWSKDELSREFGLESSLGEVISLLERRFEVHGEMLCEIYVNNAFLSENDELKMSETKISELENLQVLTRNTSELFASTREAMVQLLPKLKAASMEVTALINGGDFDIKAKGLMVDLCNAMEWFTQALIHIKSDFLNSKDAPGGSADAWSECEQKYRLAIRCVSESYENNDTVLLADTLSYDFSEALDHWARLLKPSKAL